MINMRNYQLLLLLVVIILALFGIVYYATVPKSSSIRSDTMQDSKTTPSDTTSAINDDLQKLDVGEIDSQFQDIDRDLNSL